MKKKNRTLKGNHSHELSVLLPCYPAVCKMLNASSYTPLKAPNYIDCMPRDLSSRNTTENILAN